MKNLMYFLFIVVMFFSASCSDEKENIVNPEQEKTLRKSATVDDNGIPKPDGDFVCRDPVIDYFYTSRENTESMTIETLSPVYEGEWRFYISKLIINTAPPYWEIWILIDGKLKIKYEQPYYTEGTFFASGFYTLNGFGTHTVEIQAKNHCIFNSVSDITKRILYVTLRDPRTPHAPTLTEGSNINCPSLTWTAMMNTTSYNIYKRTLDTEDILIRTTTSTSFIDTSERLYKEGDFLGANVAAYKVVAVGPFGNSPFSNVIAFRTVKK